MKVVASGVCHSDLSVLQAKLPMPPPCVLGHEGAGIVEEVGKGVKRPQARRPRRAGVGAALRAAATSASPATAHLCEAGVQSAMAGEEFVFEKDGMPIGRMAGVGSFADHTVVRAIGGDQDPRGRAARPRLPGRLRRDDRRRRGDQHRQGAAGRHRRRLRLRRRRPQRHPGRGAVRRGAHHRRRPGARRS